MNETLFLYLITGIFSSCQMMSKARSRRNAKDPVEEVIKKDVKKVKPAGKPPAAKKVSGRL